MVKELILMVAYDNGEPKNKVEMFVANHFKDLYKIRNDFKERKDIKPISYKIFQLIEEKSFEEMKIKDEY